MTGLARHLSLSLFSGCRTTVRSACGIKPRKFQKSKATCIFLAGCLVQNNYFP